MVNPFDLKAALAAKHAQHVVLIHFPIALFIAGVAFDFLAQWTKRQNLAAAAYCNFLVAAVATVPTMITGLLAWQWQLEGQRLRGTLLLHLIFGVSSGTLICVVWLIHWNAKRRQNETLRILCMPLEALTVALLALTGHLGGFLSGVNGPG
jgi:uncharacterized membrane protein